MTQRKATLLFAIATLFLNSAPLLASNEGNQPSSKPAHSQNSEPTILPVFRTEIEGSDLNRISLNGAPVIRLETDSVSADSNDPQSMAALAEYAENKIDSEVKAGAVAETAIYAPDSDVVQEALERLEHKDGVKVEKGPMPDNFIQRFRQTAVEYGRSVRDFNPLADKMNVHLTITKFFFNGVGPYLATMFFSAAAGVPWQYHAVLPLVMTSASSLLTLYNPVMPWNLIKAPTSKNPNQPLSLRDLAITFAKKGPVWNLFEVGFAELGRATMVLVNMVAAYHRLPPVYQISSHLEVFYASAVATGSQGTADVVSASIFDQEELKINDRLLGVPGKEDERLALIRKAERKRNIRQTISSVLEVTLLTAQIAGIHGAQFGFLLYMAGSGLYAANHVFGVTDRIGEKIKSLDERAMAENPPPNESALVKTLRPAFRAYHSCEAALLRLKKGGDLIELHLNSD